MITASSAAVVIFLPLALLSGTTGYFFQALANTLATSLVVSLALALLLAPIITYRLSYHTDTHTREKQSDPILARYEPLLRTALKHKLLIGYASLCVMAGTVLLLPEDAILVEPLDFAAQPDIQDASGSQEFSHKPGQPIT